jgi:hypothetical protein
MPKKRTGAIMKGLSRATPFPDVMRGIMSGVGYARALAGGADFEKGPAGTTIANMPEAMPGGDMQALGNVILSNPNLDPRVREQLIKGHELGHVLQSEIAGPFLPLLQAGAGAVQMLRGKDFYYDNPIERSAPAMAQMKMLMEGENLPSTRAAKAKSIKGYKGGTMPMKSTAGYKPGLAYARQDPYQIPAFNVPGGELVSPGGGGNMFQYMQGILERQMKMKEAMMRAQLGQMQQQRRAAEEEMERARDRARREGTVFSRSMRGKMGLSGTQRQDWNSPAEYARRMSAGTGSMSPIADMHFAQTMGVPMMNQGMMQSGRIMGQLGGEALRTNQFNPFAMPVQPVNPSGQIRLGGMGLGQMPIPAQPGDMAFVGPIRNRSAEKGGRVPKTGTYKLHKGEIVLNKGQSDFLFPNAGYGSEKKSYQPGSMDDMGAYELYRADRAARSKMIPLGSAAMSPMGAGAISPMGAIDMAPVSGPGSIARYISKIEGSAGGSEKKLLGEARKLLTAGNAGADDMVRMATKLRYAGKWGKIAAGVIAGGAALWGLSRADFETGPPEMIPPGAPGTPGTANMPAYALSPTLDADIGAQIRGSGLGQTMGRVEDAVRFGLGAPPRGGSPVAPPIGGEAPMPSPVPPRQPMPASPVSPPLGIKGLEISESPISARGKRLRPEQEKVKQYTLTGTPEGDKGRMDRLRSQAEHWGRNYDYYQQKADALLEHIGSMDRPNPEVMKLLAERQKVADRYKKRADQAIGEADAISTRLEKADTQKEVAEIQQRGLTERAVEAAQAGQMKEIREQFSDVEDSIKGLYNDFLQENIEGNALMGGIIAELTYYMPYLERRLKGEGVMQEGDTIQDFVSRVVEQVERTGSYEPLEVIYFALGLAS